MEQKGVLAINVIERRETSVDCVIKALIECIKTGERFSCHDLIFLLHNFRDCLQIRSSQPCFILTILKWEHSIHNDVTMGKNLPPSSLHSIHIVLNAQPRFIGLDMFNVHKPYANIIREQPRSCWCRHHHNARCFLSVLHNRKGGGWVLGSFSPLMGRFILIGLFAGGSIEFSRDNIYRLFGRKSHPCTKVFKYLIADSAGFSEGFRTHSYLVHVIHEVLNEEMFGLPIKGVVMTWLVRSFFSIFVIAIAKAIKDYSNKLLKAVKLRLANGSGRCVGRVEIHYRGQWGTVFGIIWDLQDAAVVCRELGCGTAVSAPGSAHFGEGSGPIVTVAVRCSGNECGSVHQLAGISIPGHTAMMPARSTQGTGPVWKENHRCRGNKSRLSECPVTSGENFNCSLGNDANVMCSDESWSLRLTKGGSRCDGRVDIYHNGRWGRVQDSLWDLNDANVVCRTQTDGGRRLSDGGSPCTGRVEIYYNGTWGSVCDDSWDLTDADVVCKQLHCGKALDVTLLASWGQGSGPVWLEGLNCSGEESFLWQCPSGYWGSHDCSHKEDVKIMCSEHKELRLVNGKHRCEGRAEVFYNGIWGTVCSAALDRHDAEVICKQLQCGPLVSIDYNARSFGEGSGPIWLDEMECNFHESAIWQCRTDPWGQDNCYHREDAGVSCSDSDVGLRLVGGNTNCSGRVEITCNNTWGTFCDDSWDMADANVVCRQLNCGSALLATGGAAFGQGEGDIWFDEVRCTGSESFLSDCPSSASAQSDCDHKEDASVICSEYPKVQICRRLLLRHEDEITSIPLVIGITLGILLICEFIALIVPMQRQSSRKGSVTGGWGSPTAMYQAIYEEIQDIPPVKDPALTRGSVSASIDSHNHIEYYTSHILDDQGRGSENPDENSSSVQDLGDYDDAETTDNDSQSDHLLLEGVDGDFFRPESAGGDL
ncbi:deleted in malignant brain tumors 1 protein-like [Carcharodon carcharias]|uniref:deleted in malignant brain tumors 1 protein-like n=1 Tax=Carcharodon carcharias TaxID=13397 RepID=UPI001B7E7193|nr:deleted in malignant brain tumors 1 protein-like [Carcharodon carcharias]